MGNNGNLADLKNMFDTLVKDLHAQFDSVKEQFDNINNRLTTIEQGHTTEETTAVALQREHEITATKLEAAAKPTMEEAGKAFLKEQNEKVSSATIPEIVDDLEGKIFDVFKPEAPKMNLLSPYPHMGTPPGSFPVLTPRIHKLNFPAYDDKDDPLPWINRCEQFFRGQKTPEAEQV
jgi:hypothetical protein